MALFPAAHRVKISALATVQGNKYVNVFHYVLNDVWDGADLAAAFETAWLVEIKEEQQSALQYDLIEIRDLDNPVLGQDVATAQGGQLLGELAPLNNAIVMKKLTDSIGRSFRGRSYIGGLSETQFNNGGDVVAASQTAIRAAGLNALNLTGPGVENAQMVVWSSVLATDTVVTDIQVNTIVRNQRRRTKGVGE